MKKQTELCPRCGVRVGRTVYLRHRRFCERLPTPDELRVEKERDELTVAELARRYEIGPHAMKDRLERFVDVAKDEQYCKECELLLTHPDVQRVGQYCRACAIKIARKQALRQMVPA